MNDYVDLGDRFVVTFRDKGPTTVGTEADIQNRRPEVKPSPLHFESDRRET